MGEEAHIVGAVSQARDVDDGWTEEFGKKLCNLMLEKNVRRLGVHSSGRDEDLAHAATVVFANVVSVATESHPFCVRKEYDASRAAVAAAAFRIAGRERPSLLYAPVYLMAFGGAAKDDVNYTIPGTNLEVRAWYGTMAGESAGRLDKIPLANNGWLDKIGPRYYKFKQIRAPLIQGVCAVYARAVDIPSVTRQTRSMKARLERSGKGSGKGSHKGSDKSPGKGSGKGSGNAAQPPEPAASQTAKVMKSIKMIWPTPPEQSKAATRKEPATTEDPKAAKAKKTKRPKEDKSTRKKPRGAENAAVAATSSGSHGPGWKEDAGGAWDAGEQWKRRRKPDDLENRSMETRCIDKR